MAASPAALNLAQVAYGAGFRGKALTDMVSLGLSESGGNPNALNDNPQTGDYSVGYWQINYFRSLAADRTKKYGPPDTLRGTDPLGPQAQANAKAAYDLSGGGQNLNPWQADFNNGSYYTNLPAAQDAVNAFLGGATSPGSVGSPNTQFPIQLASDSSNNPGDTALIPEGNKCLIKLPGIGSVCLLNQSQARALLGGLILASGVVVTGLGAALLLSNAVQGTPVAQLASLASGPVGMVSKIGNVTSQTRADRSVRATPEQRRQARENTVARKTQSGRASAEQRQQWASEGFATGAA